MKKALYSIATTAFVVLLGSTVAHASTPAYYVVMMQGANQNGCTSATSDLGLGGGVFVAGTKVCQNPMLLVLGYDNDQTSDYYDDRDSDEDYSYDEDDSYDYEDDSDQDDSDYEYDDSNDESYDEDEDSNDDSSNDTDENDSDSNDSDNGSGGSHRW